MAFLEHRPGQQEEVVALVDDVGPEFCRCGLELAVGVHGIGEFEEFIEYLRQRRLEAVDPVYIAAHFSFCHTVVIIAQIRCYHPDHMTLSTQSFDQLFDMDCLAILGGSAVVVQDTHVSGRSSLRSFVHDVA